ncbi:hypothetical protein HY623_02065 [Candidatus Uhrbacteria bacterium]|nr:hypothetical protein [Candidatus Uhrbacteria bacterium]
MIVSAALIPHSPLLLPSIGKDAHDMLVKTLEGLATLKASCANLGVDTVVLIKTPEQGRRRRTVFELQLAQQYCVDVSKFGDLVTKGSFACDTVLGTEIKGNIRDAHISLALISNDYPEYTAGIPLLTLFEGLPIKVVIVQPPDTDTRALFAFGCALTSTLQRSAKRIICLAAGDCAHCVKKGKKEEHEKICLPFDYMFIDALRKKAPDALLSIKREDVRRLNACAVQPSIVLRGILDSLSWNTHLLSYEAPFGVGYTVLEYRV